MNTKSFVAVLLSAIAIIFTVTLVANRKSNVRFVGLAAADQPVDLTTVDAQYLLQTPRWALQECLGISRQINNEELINIRDQLLVLEAHLVNQLDCAQLISCCNDNEIAILEHSNGWLSAVVGSSNLGNDSFVQILAETGEPLAVDAEKLHEIGFQTLHVGKRQLFEHLNVAPVSVAFNSTFTNVGFCEPHTEKEVAIDVENRLTSSIPGPVVVVFRLLHPSKLRSKRVTVCNLRL